MDTFLFIYGIACVLIAIGGIYFLYKIEYGTTINITILSFLAAFGVFFITMSLKERPIKPVKLNQTIVLFDNGNNKIDTLVFESDTIHADKDNIW